MDKKQYNTWFNKATDDLHWTKANLKEEIFYGACFTAQQAAEKALKAYLISQGKRARKIHDLGALLEDCGELDEDFLKLKEATAVLTDYYIQVRYPDMSEFMKYSREEAERAYQYAEEIVDLVRQKVIAEEINNDQDNNAGGIQL